MRLAIVAAASAGVLISGGTTAVADPPPGWTGGDEYEFADVGWRHHGWYPDRPGNWHTGYVNVEEDDDGVTGVLADWFCPSGVTPPMPPNGDPAEAGCRYKGGVGIDSTRSHPYFDVASFDQATNQLSLHGDFSVNDDELEPAGTVRIDLTFQGRGVPETSLDVYADGAVADYSEYFYDVKVWGKVDGHRVRGPVGTEQFAERVGFRFDSMTPAP